MSAIALSVALDCKATIIPFDDEINSISSRWPLRPHSVFCGEKPLQDKPLKLRLGMLALFLDRTQNCIGVTRVLNEPTPKVATLKMAVWIERVYDP